MWVRGTCTYYISTSYVVSLRPIQTTCLPSLIRTALRAWSGCAQCCAGWTFRAIRTASTRDRHHIQDCERGNSWSQDTHTHRAPQTDSTPKELSRSTERQRERVRCLGRTTAVHIMCFEGHSFATCLTYSTYIFVPLLLYDCCFRFCSCREACTPYSTQHRDPTAKSAWY